MTSNREILYSKIVNELVSFKLTARVSKAMATKIVEAAVIHSLSDDESMKLAQFMADNRTELGRVRGHLRQGLDLEKILQAYEIRRTLQDDYAVGARLIAPISAIVTLLEFFGDADDTDLVCEVLSRGARSKDLRSFLEEGRNRGIYYLTNLDQVAV